MMINNSKVFLNMVIHDLRNPASQINFTLNMATDSVKTNYKEL